MSSELNPPSGLVPSAGPPAAMGAVQGSGVPDRMAGGEGLSKRFRLSESIIQVVLFACGILSVLTTLGIIVVLVTQSWLFFSTPGVSLSEFFTGTVWQPQIGRFGMLPLLTATVMTSTIAMLFALPLGLAVALYLSEYAPERVRATLKPILELLAGIPTVIFGYFALTLITPMLRSIFGQDTVQIYNTAAAGITIGILVLPMVASMSEDALRAGTACPPGGRLRYGGNPA